MKYRLLGFMAILFTMTSCGWLGLDEEKKQEYVERPADEVYQSATKALDEENYLKAASLFQTVERQHPYSKWAVKAKLMTAYSYYYEGLYDDAIGALEHFIKLHPSNSEVPYAYYLRALCYYEQISDVSRDQEMTILAQQNLKELIQRFPESKYAKDARMKLDLTQDHLAGKEMVVGRYYLKKDHYSAALNRFLNVIKKYEKTSHTPEALHRLVECYLMMGLNDEAQKAAAVLGHNFPDSKWYEYSYAMMKGHDVVLRDSDGSNSWLGFNF